MSQSSYGNKVVSSAEHFGSVDYGAVLEVVENILDRIEKDEKSEKNESRANPIVKFRRRPHLDNSEKWVLAVHLHALYDLVEQELLNEKASSARKTMEPVLGLCSAGNSKMLGSYVPEDKKESLKKLLDSVVRKFCKMASSQADQNGVKLSSESFGELPLLETFKEKTVNVGRDSMESVDVKNSKDSKGKSTRFEQEFEFKLLASDFDNDKKHNPFVAETKIISAEDTATSVAKNSTLGKTPVCTISFKDRITGDSGSKGFRERFAKGIVGRIMTEPDKQDVFDRHIRKVIESFEDRSNNAYKFVDNLSRGILARARMHAGIAICNKLGKDKKSDRFDNNIMFGKKLFEEMSKRMEWLVRFLSESEETHGCGDESFKLFTAGCGKNENIDLRNMLRRGDIFDKAPYACDFGDFFSSSDKPGEGQSFTCSFGMRMNTVVNRNNTSTTPFSYHVNSFLEMHEKPKLVEKVMLYFFLYYKLAERSRLKNAFLTDGEFVKELFSAWTTFFSQIQKSAPSERGKLARDRIRSFVKIGFFDGKNRDREFPLEDCEENEKIREYLRKILPEAGLSLPSCGVSKTMYANIAPDVVRENCRSARDSIRSDPKDGGMSMYPQYVRLDDAPDGNALASLEIEIRAEESQIFESEKKGFHVSRTWDIGGIRMLPLVGCTSSVSERMASRQLNSYIAPKSILVIFPEFEASSGKAPLVSIVSSIVFESLSRMIREMGVPENKDEFLFVPFIRLYYGRNDNSGKHLDTNVFETSPEDIMKKTMDIHSHFLMDISTGGYPQPSGPRIYSASQGFSLSLEDKDLRNSLGNRFFNFTSSLMGAIPKTYRIPSSEWNESFDKAIIACVSSSKSDTLKDGSGFDGCSTVLGSVMFVEKVESCEDGACALRMRCLGTFADTSFGLFKGLKVLDIVAGLAASMDVHKMALVSKVPFTNKVSFIGGGDPGEGEPSEESSDSDEHDDSAELFFASTRIISGMLAAFDEKYEKQENRRNAGLLVYPLYYAGGRMIACDARSKDRKNSALFSDIEPAKISGVDTKEMKDFLSVFPCGKMGKSTYSNSHRYLALRNVHALCGDDMPKSHVESMRDAENILDTSPRNSSDRRDLSLVLLLHHFDAVRKSGGIQAPKVNPFDHLIGGDSIVKKTRVMFGDKTVTTHYVDKKLLFNILGMNTRFHKILTSPK